MQRHLTYRLLVAASAFLAAVLLSVLVHSEDLSATVVKVIDGDTIKVTLAGPMPNLFRRQSVRLLGCDTPEKRDKRPEVAALARTATAFTASMVRPGDVLMLHNIAYDKYGGRLLAHVSIGGEDLCAALIEAGYAKPYGGGHKEW